jgi:poly-gamma-glutamate synthesis protein (capsule biosynthesis protein)
MGLPVVSEIGMATAEPGESGSLSILAVGDIMLDRRLLPPRTFFHHPDYSSCSGPIDGQIRYPFPNTAECARWLSELGRDVQGIQATSHAVQSTALRLPEDAKAYDYPFRMIKDELRTSEIVFGNLECPLSARGRRLNNDACYSSSPEFAGAMAEAGVKVLSFANNHCFDYGETAFLDTLDALRASGIAPVGAGASLAEARKPALFRVNGVTVAFIAYSLVGPHWIWATPDECGAAPLNPMMVGQDIQRIRRQADVVVLSVHWGTELRAVPYPRIVELAHDCINAGADAILGHHPHVPGAVEVYGGRPIFYSLGNFIFGHDHEDWGDGMMARLHIEKGSLLKAEIIPINGRYQPEVASGEEATLVGKRVASASSRFKTPITFAEGIGTIGLTK